MESKDVCLQDPAFCGSRRTVFLLPAIIILNPSCSGALGDVQTAVKNECGRCRRELFRGNTAISEPPAPHVFCNVAFLKVTILQQMLQDHDGCALTELP